MFLSVIIPTRNRAKYLSDVLESLTLQTYPHDMFEVLVVDNGSTDNTHEVCASFEKWIPQLRYFYEETPGLHAVRHLGMKMAKSEILVYADDDIEAFPTWLEGISESFEDEKVVLVGGKNLPKFEVEPPAWVCNMWAKNCDGHRILGFLSILDFGDVAKDISPYYVFGCNFSIRKSTLIEAGGFHPDGMPQDMIIYRGDGESYLANYIVTQKYRALYNPKASIYHKVPKGRLTPKYYQERSFREGISTSYRKIRNGSTNNWKQRISIMMRTILRFVTFQKMPQHIKDARRAFNAGYRFHKKMVRNNPDLYKWVAKEHYFD